MCWTATQLYIQVFCHLAVVKVFVACKDERNITSTHRLILGEFVILLISLKILLCLLEAINFISLSYFHWQQKTKVIY